MENRNLTPKKQAYELIKPQIPERLTEVLDAIKEIQPCSYITLAKFLKARDNSTTNRISELERLGQSLNEEFKYILILDKTADLSDLKNQEREFIIKANKEDFWDKNLHDYTLKKFIRYRKKYKEIMQSKKIKHSENLGQKISEK